MYDYVVRDIVLVMDVHYVYRLTILSLCSSLELLLLALWLAYIVYGVSMLFSNFITARLLVILLNRSTLTAFLAAHLLLRAYHWLLLRRLF
jgi:hypothetical protein